MSNFRIQLPHELTAKLLNDAIDVERQQADMLGNLELQPTIPPYPQFVQHLMKGCETPQQELMHATVGMAGEVGEILEVFEVTTGLARAAAMALDRAKKVWIYGKELDAEALIKELGDLRFYYQAALNYLGVTDQQVVAQNILKLRARYSEGKYSDAQAIAQADKAPLGRDRSAPSIPRRFLGRTGNKPVAPTEFIDTTGTGWGNWYVQKVFRSNADNLWNAVRSRVHGDNEIITEECGWDPSHDRDLIQRRVDTLNLEGTVHG